MDFETLINFTQRDLIIFAFGFFVGFFSRVSIFAIKKLKKALKKRKKRLKNARYKQWNENFENLSDKELFNIIDDKK